MLSAIQSFSSVISFGKNKKRKTQKNTIMSIHKSVSKPVNKPFETAQIDAPKLNTPLEKDTVQIKTNEHTEKNALKLSNSLNKNIDKTNSLTESTLQPLKPAEYKCINLLKKAKEDYTIEKDAYSGSKIFVKGYFLDDSVILNYYNLDMRLLDSSTIFDFKKAENGEEIYTEKSFDSQKALQIIYNPESNVYTLNDIENDRICEYDDKLNLIKQTEKSTADIKGKTFQILQTTIYRKDGTIKTTKESRDVKQPEILNSFQETVFDKDEKVVSKRILDKKSGEIILQQIIPNEYLKKDPTDINLVSIETMDSRLNLAYTPFNETEEKIKKLIQENRINKEINITPSIKNNIISPLEKVEYPFVKLLKTAFGPDIINHHYNNEPDESYHLDQNRIMVKLFDYDEQTVLDYFPVFKIEDNEHGEKIYTQVINSKEFKHITPQKIIYRPEYNEYTYIDKKNNRICNYDENVKLKRQIERGKVNINGKLLPAIYSTIYEKDGSIRCIVESWDYNNFRKPEKLNFYQETDYDFLGRISETKTLNNNLGKTEVKQSFE